MCVFCALSKTVTVFHSGDVFICIFCFKCARLRHAVATGANLFPCVIVQLYVAREAHYTGVSYLHVLRVLPGTFDWTYIYLCRPPCLYQPAVFPVPSRPVPFRGRHMVEAKKKKLLLDHKTFLVCIDFDRIALCCKFSDCEAAVMESSKFSLV